MEPVLIMKTASVLLALAALGGMTMAGILFSGKPQPPTWLAMAHGLLAAAAITLLLYAYFTVGLPSLACWALLLFLIAAGGGPIHGIRFGILPEVAPVMVSQILYYIESNTRSATS